MTDLQLTKLAFLPSILIALTGIILPIAVSFLLIPLFVPSKVGPLTAFAAGAALSSTSFGTTFAILSAAKLTSTRVGTILTTAAMIDDVIGLVMVGVISSLSEGIDAGTIARPIGMSIAFLLAVLIFSILAGIVVRRLSISRLKVWADELPFLVTGMAILGMTAAAGYAGTSILFSAYLTGVSASYLCRKTALQCYQRYILCIRS